MTTAKAEPRDDSVPSSPGSPAVAALTPRLLGWEIAVVLAASVAAYAVESTISFVGVLTSPESLSAQQANLVVPGAQSERPWLDLAVQVFRIVNALVPVVLVVYLLHRTRESAARIGFDVRRPGFDLGYGALLAGLIGAGGLVVYLVSVNLGLTRPIAPSTLHPHWWQIPVLVLQAVKNGVLEEVIVVGYLMHRFGQLGRMWGWSPRRSAIVATATSSGLRAFYHLYQGVGMFFGNLVMGVVFCWFYHRFGRVMPLVVAHAVIDIVAFVGAVYLIGALDWLPV
ncbi:CPBP family intramembrane metalloprotease [Spiractinospora alimapuensis]|uniref:CPBP family intramembrane glutamic endopeptidase n=1 Tax=Spiractinospora alimapuensis TaxID=2820884 RepID=UPI001F3E7777|nr:CPBP family intramembrane glutamic endopeptidase [Spiractinospora alimapuensis]QVQ52999.1 CPBP family intramembrane metalloprotease [Spiractinospora alimapuensis]